MKNGANVLTVLGDTYVQDDVVIGGNLDVRGTLTSINTENTTIKDAIIEIGKGNISSDMGIIMERPGTNIGLGYRDAVDELIFAYTNNNATSTTIVPSSELIDVRVHGRLHVNSNLVIDTDTLYVDAINDRVGINTSNPQTDFDVIGEVAITSNLSVDGNTLHVDSTTDRVGINTLYPLSDFHVEGETYISGNVTVDTNTFHVDTTNDRVGINTLNPNTDFHVQGDTYISGNVDVDTDLTITGNMDVQSELTVSSNAIVTGNVDVQSELNVVGNAYVSSNVIVTGNVDVERNLNVATDAIVTGNVDVQSELNVTGNAYISSNVIVTGNVDIQTDLNVVGDAYVATYYGDGGLLSNVNLQVVSDHGNSTFNTIQFTNATTGMVTTSNLEVGSNISVAGLSINKMPIVGAGNFLEDSSISKVDGKVIISSDVEILGNILVDGSSYTIESNSLVINDRIIGIANNNVSHQLDVGIIIQHPGKNIALVHHGEAVEGDPHDHTFTIGYTQNTVTDNHIFNDSNLITVEILGNLITQNNLIVSETLDVSGTVTFADDLVVGAASNLFVDVSTSRVGINEATPDASLDVGGDVNIQSDVNATSKTSAALVVAGGVGVGGDVYASNVVLSGDFTVDTDTLIVNSTTDRVGINKAVPTVALDVDGDVVISNDFTVDTNTLHVDSGTDSVGI